MLGISDQKGLDEGLGSATDCAPAVIGRDFSQSSRQALSFAGWWGTRRPLGNPLRCTRAVRGIFFCWHSANLPDASSVALLGSATVGGGARSGRAAGSYPVWPQVQILPSPPIFPPALVPATRAPTQCHRGTSITGQGWRFILCAYGAREKKRKAICRGGYSGGTSRSGPGRGHPSAGVKWPKLLLQKASGDGEVTTDAYLDGLVVLPTARRRARFETSLTVLRGEKSTGQTAKHTAGRFGAPLFLLSSNYMPKLRYIGNTFTPLTNTSKYAIILGSFENERF